MNILTVEDLQDFGITRLELQQALSINYQGRKLQRKLDIPKKFRQRALEICEQIHQLRKVNAAILTETNFSYTIWEEETTNRIEVESKSISEVNSDTSISSSLSEYLKNNQQNIRDSQLNNSIQAHIRKIRANQTQTSILEAKSPANNQSQNQVNESTIETQIEPQQNTQETIAPNIERSIPATETKIVKKYRGVIIEETPKPPMKLRMAKKEVIKYRGVIVN